MIIHSIVPQEHIFPANQEVFSNQTECTWNNVPMLVEKEGSKCRVIRIMSSNPADYLNGNIQPGSYVNINEINFS
ncbi:ribonuclease [Siminovitchia acidinfaciens]|uniref:Ribonuclease n=1 Tax=Siminovitchia acidinfaciens TaxID=2321395 RepID=A0A429Y2R8_9BACI|nr:YlzJ-like family protein [Siminovitchia acidinfaciens]RST75535.1 ribonuclease [Siminovitchia acidinfaciens]